MTYTLTSDDVKALRRAHTVSIHADSRGRAMMRAFIEKRPDEGFTDAELRIFDEQNWVSEHRIERKRELRVEGGVGAHTGYPDGDVTSDYYFDAGTELIGYEMLHSLRYDKTWRTISKQMRPDQRLAVYFKADGHSNGYLKQADLHCDRLTLDLAEPTGDDDRFEIVASFDIPTGVTPANSARPVRAVGSWEYGTAKTDLDKLYVEEVSV